MRRASDSSIYPPTSVKHDRSAEFFEPRLSKRFNAILFPVDVRAYALLCLNP